MCGGTEVDAVDAEAYHLDMRDEVAGRPTRDNRELDGQDSRSSSAPLRVAVRPSLAPIRILIDARVAGRLRRSRPAGESESSLGRPVKLAAQRLRRVDIDLAFGAGRTVGQELQPVFADLERVSALQQVLLDRLPIDGRAIGRAQIFEVDVAELV